MRLLGWLKLKIITPNFHDDIEKLDYSHTAIQGNNSLMSYQIEVSMLLPYDLKILIILRKIYAHIKTHT